MTGRVQTAVTEHKLLPIQKYSVAPQPIIPLRTPAALLNNGKMCAAPTAGVKHAICTAHPHTDAEQRQLALHAHQHQCRSSDETTTCTRPPLPVAVAVPGRRASACSLQLTEGAPQNTPMRLRWKDTGQHAQWLQRLTAFPALSSPKQTHAAAPGSVLRRSAAQTTRHQFRRDSFGCTNCLVFSLTP